jgi:hypothetical protein
LAPTAKLPGRYAAEIAASGSARIWSMLAMRTLAISEVLSNDHHFTQEGFTILFP